jgi:hypothetical protein
MLGVSTERGRVWGRFNSAGYMSPVLVFVVPAVVTAVLGIVTGLAYGRSHRPYLLWWTAVWVLALVYYLVFIASTVAASAQSDVFANVGAVMLLLGWLRVVAIWGGARLLTNRPVGWRTRAVVGRRTVVSWRAPMRAWRSSTS